MSNWVNCLRSIWRGAYPGNLITIYKIIIFPWVSVTSQVDTNSYYVLLSAVWIRRMTWVSEFGQQLTPGFMCTGFKLTRLSHSRQFVMPFEWPLSERRFSLQVASWMSVPWSVKWHISHLATVRKSILSTVTLIVKLKTNYCDCCFTCDSSQHCQSWLDATHTDWKKKNSFSLLAGSESQRWSRCD